MTILNPDHLLDQVDLLLSRPKGGPHRQANLRRAIATTYYAVFHTILIAAADLVAGRGRRSSPVYNLVYRSIDHRSLSALCLIVARPPISAKYREFCPAAGFSPTLQSFARRLPELQQARHAADYDPGRRFKASATLGMARLARAALLEWSASPADERDTFLMLLLFPPR